MKEEKEDPPSQKCAAGRVAQEKKDIKERKGEH